jgi:type I restriction enzyme, S subunit
MSFPRYEKYKDSGVEWIGAVPDHWAVQPLKRHSRLLTEKTDRRESPIALENITSWTGRYIQTESEFEGEGVAFEPGDILFGKLRPYLAKALVAQTTGEAVGDFLVIRADAKVHPKFAQYQLLSRECISIINGSTFGSKMPRASWDFVGMMAFALPPTEEQTTIATFLDHETAKIDALVEEQKRLIELLKEKRQAVISHAVTKGLNPSAPMKDSGVEWLGEVPAHWAVRAIKHVVSTRVTDGPHETPNFPDEGVPFVSAEAVSAGYVNFDKIRGFISEQDHLRYSEKYRPKRGDIFMVKSGATTGLTAIVETDMEFNIWSPLAVIRCGHASDPYFVLNFMRSKNFLEAVTLNWSFGTQQNIGMGVIENLAVTVPPIDEQRLIAEFLVRESGKLDALTAEAGAAMNLLQERRTALISAAVTGKIDVRSSAAVATADNATC